MATYGNYSAAPALSANGVSVGPYGGSFGYSAVATPAQYSYGYNSAPLYAGTTLYSGGPQSYGLASYGPSRLTGGYYAPSYSSSLDDEALAYGGAYAYAPAPPPPPQPPVSLPPRPVAYSGPVLSGLPAASSYGGVSGGIEQYGVSLGPSIDAAYEAAALHRRQPVVRRQVIQVPGQPGQVKQIIRRVPTPIPDVIERVFVVKPQRDIINLVIERPSTPPPQIKTRTVVQRPSRPIIQSQVVRVPPRSIGYAPAAAAPVAVAAQPAQIQYAPQYVSAPAVQPMQSQPAPLPAYAYDVQAAPLYSGYSESSSTLGYGGGYAGGYGAGYAAAPYSSYGGAAAYPSYGGFSTGLPANYGLPSYAGATTAYASQPYGYSAYPSGGYNSGYQNYVTASNAYPLASANPYGSIISANPAGNAYYGSGYPYRY